MLAVIAVVGLTIFWTTSQRAVEEARQVWLKAPEQIERLLEDSEMVTLESVLRETVVAGKVLGRSDAESRRIGNLLEETMAVNNIAVGDLLTGFHKAYNERGLLTEDAYEQVNSVCHNGTFIFDSYLQRAPGLSAVYLIDFPATPGRHPVQIIVPLPAVAGLLEMTGDSRAVFAARIDAVTAPDAGTFQPWILHVAPDSFVLLTSAAHCAAIGLSGEYDSTLAGVLQRQREFVETSETWRDRAASAVFPATKAKPGSSAE